MLKLFFISTILLNITNNSLYSQDLDWDNILKEAQKKDTYKETLNDITHSKIPLVQLGSFINLLQANYNSLKKDTKNLKETTANTLNQLEKELVNMAILKSIHNIDSYKKSFDFLIFKTIPEIYNNKDIVLSYTHLEFLRSILDLPIDIQYITKSIISLKQFCQ